MLKILSASLPLIDFLYIFQSFEYERWNFLKWSIQHPLRRKMQNKKQIAWTSKALMLLVICLGIMLATSIGLAMTISSNGLWGLGMMVMVLMVVWMNIAPVFLVGASLMLLPLEMWGKYQLVSKAVAKRRRLKDLKVVGITGSFAKTSTKEMLYTILRKDFRVVKTPKSYNTEIGIARSIIQDVKNNTAVFIAEMDAYHPGEISRLAGIVKPNIGVITAIAPQHLERFGSMEKLAKTQFEICSQLNSEGVLVLNKEDEWSLKLATLAKNQVVWFGSGVATMSVRNIGLSLEGTTFELVNEKVVHQVELPLLGRHHALNFAAAAMVAKELGMSLEQIAKRAKWVMPTPHRLEIKKIGGMTVIDNSYNSNSTSYKASFELLKELPGLEKIIITPGLVELGEKHFEENRQMGKQSAKAADKVVIIGENAKKALRTGLIEGGMKTDHIYYFDNPKVAIEKLASFANPEAVVLIENDLPDQYL